MVKIEENFCRLANADALDTRRQINGDGIATNSYRPTPTHPW